MDIFTSLRNEINQTLQNLPEWKEQPERLYAPAVYTLQEGGKRLRPVLCLAGCRLFKGNTAAALLPAAGLEVFHNFTLLHDDVMDRAETRRGRATVHVKWDTDTAILSGDAMFAVAVSLISQAPAAVLPEVMRAFNYLSKGVCEGQQYDMNFETQTEVSMPEYMEMIRLKTAVLLAGSLETGALIAGAPAPAVQTLYRFGNQLGLAFQLQDDLLDLYGNQDKFGKKTGSDIRENKKTFLYLKALELLGENGRRTLVQLFNTATVPENEAGKIAEVKRLYDSVDIKTHTQKEIERLFRDALQHLKQLQKEYGKQTDPETMQALEEFTVRLMEREY